MTCFTPTQLDDLNTRSAWLLTAMDRLVRRDQTVDLPEVAGQIQMLSAVYGRPGVAHVIRGWFDRVIEATPGAKVGDRALVMFTNPTFTGPVRTDRLAAPLRWVAEAIEACLAGDQVGFYRLVEAIPPAPDATIYLLRTAEVVASMLMTYESPGDQPFRPGMYYLTAVT